MIDTSFDFRKDTPGYPKTDPDKVSKKLREYHRMLWTKPLPDGRVLTLDSTVRGHYLYHRSELGEFSLASDSAIPTYTRWGFAAKHPDLVTAQENEAFMTIAYTIGGMMVFPGNPIDRKWTINQARGCLTRTIGDRLDLTLESIRRHYLGIEDPSGLGDAIARYRDFFALFGSFSRYVDFFLLQDLVSNDHAAVQFFAPFDDFKSSSVPQDLTTYLEYRRRSIEFIAARNRRMERYVAAAPNASH
jgi:hypothetical protein